jgi:Ni,Fe-hydrogenase I large subunit
MSTKNVSKGTDQIGSSKEALKFHTNMNRLIALFGGKETFKQSKIENTELSDLVAKLVKEEKDAAQEDFMKQAKGLIQRKRDFDKFVKAEIAKMEKAVEEKQKEFNVEMERIFGLVTKIETIESEYYSTLKDLNKPETQSTAAIAVNENSQQDENVE